MSAAVQSRLLLTRWPASLAVLALGLLFLWLAFGSTYASMAATWNRSQTYAHGWLVLPIFAWLVWRLRAELAAMSPQPQPLWLLPMACLAAMWLLGDLAWAYSVVQFAATGMLIMLVPAVLGGRVANVIAYPLAFLFFMVPVGDIMLPTLMEWTADVTVMGVRMLGVPVYRDGLQFVIPSGTWSVVEACSGARYLLASFMVGTLFGYLNYRSPWRRWLFAGVAIAVPIVANWLRAIMIVMLGHLTDNKLAAGVDHLVYGWVFFGIVVLAMFWVGSWWAEDPTPSSPVSLGDRSEGTGRPWTVLVVGLAVVIGLPPVVADRLRSETASPRTFSLPALPETAEAVAASGYAPVFVDPSARDQRTYVVAGRLITVHAVLYRQQNFTRKLVSSANALVPPEDPDWFRVSGRIVDLPVAGAGTLAIRRAELRRGQVQDPTARRIQVRQVLWVDGQFTANDLRAVALSVRGQLAGRGDDAAAITIFTDASAEPDAANAAIDEFTRQHLGTLGEWLQGALQRGPEPPN